MNTAAMQQVGLRLDAPTLAALDSMVADHAAEGIARVTRADVIRDAIATAIAAHQGRGGAQPARRRSRPVTHP